MHNISSGTSCDNKNINSSIYFAHVAAERAVMINDATYINVIMSVSFPHP